LVDTALSDVAINISEAHTASILRTRVLYPEKAACSSDILMFTYQTAGIITQKMEFHVSKYIKE
jgi:hypothetical protein